MRKFRHFNATTVEEAISFLRRYERRASVIAGGTDLIGKMKDEILPANPEAVVNLKTIDGLDFIKEDGEGMRIGALTRLEDIARHETLRARYTALAEAAQRTASPHIREMGTLGGNLCQDIRCWYYRKPKNRFPCLRKGGGRCYAIEGDSRYHSIFGGSVNGGCYAVHPSDTASALIALDAKIKTSKRTLNAEDLFSVGVSKTTVLDNAEILLEIQVPSPASGARSSFLKFALRKTIDFAIVNCAANIHINDGKVATARICLNDVWVKPYRAHKAEEHIMGKEISEDTAESAGQAAVSEAKPMKNNGYMVQIAKTMVKRAILACQ